MLHIYYKGIIIGLITGMPLGPIGAVCLKNTLANGVVFGFASGLGSCMADSIYAMVAALEVNYVTRFLAGYQHYLRLFGGIILIIFGWHTILSKKEHKQQVSNSKTLAKSFFTTFALALANPATIFSFLFVFTSYGSQNIGHGFEQRMILILGVFSGSFFWWVILVIAAGRFHKHLSGDKIIVINKFIGYVIVFSGIVFIVSIANIGRHIRPYFVHSKLFEIILKLKPHHFPKIY